MQYNAQGIRPVAVLNSSFKQHLLLSIRSNCLKFFPRKDLLKLFKPAEKLSTDF